MKKFIIILAIIFLLSITYPVNAEEIYKTKSVNTALMWSLGNTVIPMAGGLALIRHEHSDSVEIFGVPTTAIFLLTYGAYIGPSTGHFYANQWNRGFAFMGTRIAITGILSIAAQNIHEDVRPAFWLAGASLVLLIDIIDILTVPSSVRKYNFESGGIYLQPKIELGNNSYGLNIVFNF